MEGARGMLAAGDVETSCGTVKDPYQRVLLTVGNETSSTLPVAVDLNNPGSKILASLDADVTVCDRIVETANAVRTTNWREISEKSIPPRSFSSEQDLSSAIRHLAETGELNEAQEAAEDLVRMLNLSCDAIVSEVLHFARQLRQPFRQQEKPRA
ncbi:hypothetical protein F4680DRAFT_423709 [Xylaria scruposa]|nr:hypothetical protein F4680DRAFT_423709 [Xylaria scruposa]